MAIAAALCYPAITALNDGQTAVTFFGIPVSMIAYTSSVIPIIVAVWLQSYLETFLNKVLPNWLRNFTTPMLVLAIMVPFTLITIGPITNFIAGAISAGITSLQVVFSNLPVMLLWGALLTALVVVALIPWGAGPLIIGPWRGHASWHTYRGSVRWLDENVKVTPTT